MFLYESDYIDVEYDTVSVYNYKFFNCNIFTVRQVNEMKMKMCEF